MYRCHMEFYLVNCPPDVLETVQQLPPLDGFNHSFLDSNEPREALLSRADVVLAVPVAGAVDDPFGGPEAGRGTGGEPVPGR